MPPENTFSFIIKQEAEMLRFEIDDRIELRPFIEKDSEELFAVVKANLDYLHQFLFWATPEYNLESAREFIRQSQVSAAENKNQSFGVFYDGKLAGSVGFVLFNRGNRRAEIGYWIAKEFEGRGIVTKSCRELINYALVKLEMNRIEIRCATENVKSRSIPERLNFKLDGILRQYQWRHTRFYDIAIYSMLKEEWEKSNN
jgi:ribosomal-protein-serine acetyltransferase